MAYRRHRVSVIRRLLASALLASYGLASLPATADTGCGDLTTSLCGVTAQPARGDFRGLIMVRDQPDVLDRAAHCRTSASDQREHYQYGADRITGLRHGRRQARVRAGRPDTGGEQLDVLQTGHHQHRANHGRAIATAAQRRVHDIADAPGRGASIVPMTPRPPGPSSQAGRGS